MISLTRSTTAIGHVALFWPPVALIQWESLFKASSKNPSWHTNQVMVVISVAGKTNLPVLLKELLARVDRAPILSSSRACRIGFNALTNPVRMKKRATTQRPWLLTIRMKGNWKMCGLSFSEQVGWRSQGKKAWAVWQVTTRTHEMPRRPYYWRTLVSRCNHRLGGHPSHLPSYPWVDWNLDWSMAWSSELSHSGGHSLLPAGDMDGMGQRRRREFTRRKRGQVCDPSRQ